MGEYETQGPDKV
ncbi:Protein of unknown function [Bacillus mycoides]|nr:Protein of unknown function [Bacillus mycoides]